MDTLILEIVIELEGVSIPLVEVVRTKLFATGLSFCPKRKVLLEDESLYVLMISGPLLTGIIPLV